MDLQHGHHRMHKRAKTTTTASASSTTTTSTRRARTTAATTTSAAGATNTAFQPGAAASGTATRTVPNGPPTHSGLSSIDDSFYSSWSFANQGTGPLSLASSSSSPSRPGATGTSGSTTATTARLSQGALTGIIAGGAAAAVALVCVVAWCCWKRKKKGNKNEAGWWSLDDDPAKGATKGHSSRSVFEQPTDRSPAAPHSAVNPHDGGEKHHQQQRDWTRFDEKLQYPRGDLQAQRTELFAYAPPTLAPPSLSRASFDQSSQVEVPPPRLPFAAAAAHSNRPETGAYSVNDVISFSGARKNAQYPPASSVYPDSTTTTTVEPFSRSPAVVAATNNTPPPPRLTSASPARHDEQIGIAVAPPPQSTAAGAALYPPPRRPPRPSEVPSAPPSPYNYVEKAERPTSRDDGIADRFMDVMTGKVGREEVEDDDDDGDEEVITNERDDERQQQQQQQQQQKKKRQSMKPLTSNSKNKKDTIMGLTDAYAGGGEEEWARVEIDPTMARRSTLQRGSSKRSQRTVDSTTTTTKLVRKPSTTTTTTATRTAATSASSLSLGGGGAHNSSRIDSKPLKELESYFGSFAPPSSSSSSARHHHYHHPGRALSGVSEATTNGGDTSYSFRTTRTGSVASSNAAAATGAGVRRQDEQSSVSASGSQTSLSPLVVAPQAGRRQPGQYGEWTNHPLSIYSAAGEVSEIVSSSSASSSSSSGGGSPAKNRFAPRTTGGRLGVSTSSGSIGSLSGDPTAATRTTTTTVIRSPLATEPGPRVTQSEDVFGPMTTTTGGSNGEPTGYDDPVVVSLSTAERDVLNQLGLATPSSSSSAGGGERTPDLSHSSSSLGGRFESPPPHDSSDQDSSTSEVSTTTSLATPLTPQFPSQSLPFASLSSSSSPSKNNVALSGTFLEPKGNDGRRVPAPSSTSSRLRVPNSHEDLAANGFVPLAEMSKKIDPQYRSATMSLYELY